jgi:LysM repeat protein
MRSLSKDDLYYINTKRSKPVHQTQKRWVRLIVMFTIMVVMFLCGVFVQANASATDDATTINNSNTVVKKQVVTEKIVEVEKGDTLWSIASKYANKNSSTRSYMDEIMQLNGLKSTNLQIGQFIKLP